MDAAQPPVPPAVQAQQAPPIRQFAQGVQDSGGQGGQGQDSNALAASLVDGIGKQMTQLAQVLGQTKPELIPILKQGVQAMVMVAGKLKTQQSQQAQGAPSGGDSGTAPSGAAADAGAGGSSMGMPQ